MYPRGPWEIRLGLTVDCRINARMYARLRVYLFAQFLEKMALPPGVFDMINYIRVMMSVATSSLPRVTTLSSIGHTQIGGTMPLFRGMLATESGDCQSQESKV
jgi:hypothetical protein